MNNVVCCLDVLPYMTADMTFCHCTLDIQPLLNVVHSQAHLRSIAKTRLNCRTVVMQRRLQISQPIQTINKQQSNRHTSPNAVNTAAIPTRATFQKIQNDKGTSNE